MAVHALADHFARFFTRLNPSPSFEQTASSEHSAIAGLIESRRGPAEVLEPTCFLQGSYRQDTAIYAINDVDIVALCKLWYPSTSESGPPYWTRDRIFNTVAAAIAADSRYASKIRYGPTSMVIHVDLTVKVEVLPVVFKTGNRNPQVEPFVLYRPERQQWEEGYAREHQRQLTLRNSVLSGGNFKPMMTIFGRRSSNGSIPICPATRGGTGGCSRSWEPGSTMASSRSPSTATPFASGSRSLTLSAFRRWSTRSRRALSK